MIRHKGIGYTEVQLVEHEFGDLDEHRIVRVRGADLVRRREFPGSEAASVVGVATALNDEIAISADRAVVVGSAGVDFTVVTETSPIFAAVRPLTVWPPNDAATIEPVSALVGDDNELLEDDDSDELLAQMHVHEDQALARYREKVEESLALEAAARYWDRE